MIHSILIMVYFMTVFQRSSQEFDIHILDNCGPNTNVLDLNSFFVPNTQTKTKYSISKAYEINKYFEIKNYKLITKTTIDLDSLCSEVKVCCDKTIDVCNLKFAILYFNHNSLTSKTLQIQIKDINDHSPQFDKQSYEIEILESKKDPFVIELPLATDMDFGRNRIKTYQIGFKEPSSFEDFFSLVVTNDQMVTTQVGLRLNKMLDHETINRFSFELLAIDGALMTPKTGSTRINIKVLDENDNIPSFQKKLYREVIKENVFEKSPIIVLSATDTDEGDNAKILYRLSQKFSSDSTINEQFRVETNGEIFLKKALDYERKISYRFTVEASNPTPFTSNRLTISLANVEIEVENVDDEQLLITIDYREGKNYSQIFENRNDFNFAFVTIRSIESARENLEVTCKLQSFANFFELVRKQSEIGNVVEFEVRVTTALDREMYSIIKTDIRCSETNNANNKEAIAPLTVIVLDENDNAPELTVQGRTNMKENERKGKVIFTVKAHDPDEGDNGRVTFSLDKSDPISLEHLMIGEHDGHVKVHNPVDCEMNYSPVTSLSIIVTAMDHGKVPKWTDLKLTVNIEDVNDNKPIFQNTPFHFTIIENSPRNTRIGEIEIRDRDHSDKISLKMTSSNQVLLPFLISSKDGILFTINSTRSFDREKDSMFKFDIVAIDGNGKNAHSVTETVEIKVIDTNDNAPTIIFPTQNNASVQRMSYLEPINHQLILVSANDQDQSPENSRLEYSVEDASKIFGISSEDKYIVTQRDMTKHDIGDHKITIVVRDCGTPRLEATVTINIYIDHSQPKSSHNNRYIFPNGDKPSDSFLPVTSDVILYIIVIAILFVIIIVIVVFVYFLRRCKSENSCLSNSLQNCCPFSRPSPAMSKSIISGPTSKIIYNDQKPIYNNHQATLLNKERILDVKNSIEWNVDNCQVPTYNTATNPYRTSNAAYTKLPNHCYYPFQYPNIYQTIEDSHLIQKYNDITMKRMALYPSGVKNEEHYKSELNLKKWNLSSGDANEIFSNETVPGSAWITSQTPLPTRSRAVTNVVLDSDSFEDNFAVAFPQDQSTFV